MPKTSKTRRQRSIDTRSASLSHDKSGSLDKSGSYGNSVRGRGKASQPRTEHVTQADKSAVGAGLGLPEADKSAVGAINRPLQSPFLSPAVRGPESLIFPAMVALGCWGMVIYFLFLTNEANHILFGGMAVLMALLWTFSFGTRARKLLQLRSGRKI